ncbi:TPA: LPXTG cell wall anchor domain-containing protein [Streptococcus suis]|nr:LPXTG cell wall anchor domain-containing protein [Streptococcus suis]NRG98186.1 LPXTG cell wall anchor domain-containing protein [Streptococcus suis]HEM6136586.1 LPXTG cell wall anchor domain-containing protein [Streptococcus suis]HEM6372343.1 LPXTG cell wall anchor domain-containing protein [Streptococcus suis]HEP1843918.1 LPXTG cell wall anchor domain-containing protein [Streptococcus suis]
MKKNYFKLSILSLAFLGLVATQPVQADSLVYQSTLSTVPNESYAINSVGSKEFHYALFDIDKNGQEELVIGEKAENGSMNPIALYYANQQTPTLLIGKIFGPAGGDNFQVFDDGTIQIVGISRGSGEINAKLYQLSETNGEVILLQEADYRVGDTAGAIDVSGKTEVDLSLLDYKPLATPISAGSSEQAVQAQQASLLPKAMRDAALGQEISFPSELVGTWLTVETPNGTKPGRPSSLEIGEDGSYAAVYSDGNVTGNMTTLRKVSENGFVITSDGTNNGRFGLNGIGGYPGPDVKVESGILLEGQTLKNVGWTVTIGAEDYSNPSVLASFTNPNFVVKEEETTASSSTSSSSETAASSTSTSSSESKTNASEEKTTAKKQEPKKLFGVLPMTGETYSVLGIVGVIFAGIGLVRVVRKRRG